MDETDCCVVYTDHPVEMGQVPGAEPVGFGVPPDMDDWAAQDAAREAVYQAREDQRNARYFFQETLFAQLRANVDMTTAIAGAKQAYEAYKAL